MALYQGEIEKLYQNEYWVNRYYVEAADLVAAVVAMGAIYAIERNVHATQVTFTKINTRTAAPGDDTYNTSVLNTQGLRDLLGGDMLPLFNVARVDMQAAVGRPSRKYLRGVLCEPDTLAFNIVAAVQSFINTNYATPLAAVAAYVDIDGQEIVSGAVKPQVGMRQLRRGSKKSSTP